MAHSTSISCHPPSGHAAAPATFDLEALYRAASGPTPSPIAARLPQEVHVQLEARATTWEVAPGRSVTGWGFQGGAPGPTVAHVGDTLVAHLVNQLPEPTLIHWHGLRLPATMDGTDAVQRAVAPGDSFEYRFVLPDAGTFWYHSHANETVQVERGLYGALVVLGAGEPTFDVDRVLVLDDLKLDRQGRIAKTALFDRHSGREGKVALINGRAESELSIAAGQVERWRLVNACNARYLRLSLGGRPFRVIGGGGGLHTHPVTVTETLLTPGDRVELAVGPFEDEGAVITFESLRYRRSLMRWPRRMTWATLRVGPRDTSRALLPPEFAVVTPLVLPGASLAPSRVIRLGGRMTAHGHDWLINGEMHHVDKPVKVGELNVWDIVNETGMDHPFHLHGFFFQVVARDGQPCVPTSWQDTENLVGRGRVTIAFRADDRPGQWMYHGHILEHHAAGIDGPLRGHAVVRSRAGVAPVRLVGERWALRRMAAPGARRSAMRAIIYSKYGAPDVLRLAEIDKPAPRAGEILVRVRAAEVTKADCELRSFRFPVKWFWLPLRLGWGITGPRKQVLGGYFSGEVEAVGEAVTRFAPGDPVFGTSGLRMGAYAEYVCVPEGATVVAKPANITFEEAAAVPLGGLNAIHFMRMADVQPGERVLVNGAGGSIGMIAVQIAKARGAEVTAVDSGAKEAMLRGLGVDHFVDYTREDFTTSQHVIFDMVARSSYSGCVRLLEPKGRYLMVNPRLSDMLRSVVTPWFTGKSVRFAFARERVAELAELAALIEAGTLRPVVDRVYPLEQVADAHERVETEQRMGSVVLSLG